MADNTGQHEENDFYANGRADDIYKDVDPSLKEEPEVIARREELMSLSVGEILSQGHKALIVDLVVSIELGHAAPQEKAILAGLIKSSDLDLTDTNPDGETNDTFTEEEKAPLPNFTTPDYA